MSASLLVELFTEELPPKALRGLGDAFALGILNGLRSKGLVSINPAAEPFSTPRRLAVRVRSVVESAPDRIEIKKLMPSKVAFDTEGKPTTALEKRLEKEGGNVNQLVRQLEGNTEYVFLNQAIPGITLTLGLQLVLRETIEKLPIPKKMRYQVTKQPVTFVNNSGSPVEWTSDNGQPIHFTTEDVEFVRPAHGLIALHGNHIVDVSTLGLSADRITHGHRFQGVKDITVETADIYEDALFAHGKVIASFGLRQDEILRQLNEKAGTLNASLGADSDYLPLLEEVTALVEYPTVYIGEFEQKFLAVPQECLILTMRKNQKYFPLFDKAGKLTHKFLVVSNMQLENPKNIIEGNQRVVRPRLADAQFFFETDKKIKLIDRVPQLSSIVYHNKLGSQLERVERIRTLAKSVAQKIGADPQLADRAALLSKADLVTNMVGEFPELQGVMGRYYALADGEDPRVAHAIGDQYRIRFDKEDSPENLVSQSLFIADRAETLVGIWGVGLQPTGDKDPFGLRRSALALISAFGTLGAIAQKQGHPLELRIDDLLNQAKALFKPNTVELANIDAITDFVYERYRHHLLGLQWNRSFVDAVISIKPPIHEVESRARAVEDFSFLLEAESLAAANKRIGNILKKADSSASPADSALFVEPAEKALAKKVKQIGPDIQKRFAANDYAGTLKLLAQMKQPVDTFFDDVMVMDEDPKLRANRIALLRELHGLMNQVADISKLAS
jgi:glycyl-tRNA synthetase beta chain